jgi:diguanylate cyclase (GGDEF)-like protein
MTNSGQSLGDALDPRITNPDIQRLHRTWVLSARDGGLPGPPACSAEAFSWCGEHLLAGAMTSDGSLVPTHVGGALLRDAEVLLDILGPGLRACLEARRPVYGVDHAQRPSGIVTWERLLMPVRAADGAEGVLAYARPIVAQPEFFDALLTSAMEGVIGLHTVYADDGRVSDFLYVLVNPAASRMLGKPAQVLVGQGMLATEAALARLGVFEQLVQVVETGRPARFETTHALSGVEGHFLVNAVRISNGLAVTFADVTEIRRQAEELLRANARMDREVKRRALLERELRQLVDHDPLTNLLNRRAFLKAVGDELARARRYGHPMAVIMIDIDHFKRINDTWGHAIGDDAIRAVGRAAMSAVRTEDRVGRLGGEEFCIMLPETSAEGARFLAERLRIAVAAIRIEARGEKIGFTASFGVAETTTATADVDRLIDRADQALYRAKNGGRDRVVVDEAEG